MYRDIATKWTAALRSGDYTQGQGALNAGSAFCCLGVLCDLHRQEVGGEWSNCEFPDRTITSGVLTYVAAGGDYDYALLPEEVADWAGIEGNNPLVSGTPLTNLNDDGRTFQELADLIDSQSEFI